VVLGKTLTKVVGYLSGSDEERAGEFNEFIADQSIKGIFFIKGGWGCGRVLDKIDYNQVKLNPKVILGFSDITSLLCAIHHKTGLVTFHGPVGNSSWDSFSSNAFNEIACQGGVDFEITEKTQIQPLKALHKGTAKGPLIRGNLTVFCSLLGTPFFPNCKGKILFLEETHEEPYSVDRMLNSLRLAGVLNEISGLIFGQFNDCLAENPQESFALEEVVNQHVADLDIPILWGAPFGHVKEKWTLPIGVEAILNTESLSLKLFHPAVS
jgi:muramoyltetrapeptide carboxypeptidase